MHQRLCRLSGTYYSAISTDLENWVITRGRFEIARFIGSPEEMKEELAKWDLTVTPNAAGQQSSGKQ